MLLPLFLCLGVDKASVQERTLVRYNLGVTHLVQLTRLKSGYVSVSEAAAVLAVATNTVRKAVAEGRLPAARWYSNSRTWPHTRRERGRTASSQRAGRSD